MDKFLESAFIYIETDLLTSKTLTSLCDYNKIVIITDDNVGPLYAAQLKHHLELQRIDSYVITLPHGEHSKSREMKAFIEDKLFELKCHRDTCLIALGGGVVTDLVGFVAATYLRGIPVIYFPTSLLAMVDAAIGGKTGINTAYGKNLIGAFVEPKAIFADVNVLKTLPDVEYCNAFSEMIKHALVFDKSYFDYLYRYSDFLIQRDGSYLKEVIKRSCMLKLNVVQKDRYEKGERTLLNFGHTIGHAIECASHYSIPHGQAVAMGIIVESYLANRLGVLSKDDFERIMTIFPRYNISFNINYPIKEEELMAAIAIDKKSQKSKARFVMLKKIGEPYINENYAHHVDEALIANSVDYLIKNFCVS